MVKIALEICCKMEGVTRLESTGDKEWAFKIKCISCGENHATPVTFNRQSSSEIKGSRGSASLVIKCKFCSRQNSVDILEDSKDIGVYNFEDSLKKKKMLVMDCRGIEPTDWIPGEDFTCKGVDTNSEFEVSFSEGDWNDYDDKAQAPVSIEELEWSFSKCK